jgi:adenylosuccinate lyase
MVAEHERDGAAWKTEWAFLPRACGAAAVALALGADLAAGLQVDEERMRANLEAQRGYVLAEPAMLALGAEIGPRRAHELVHAAAAHGLIEGLTLNEALIRHVEGLTLNEALLRHVEGLTLNEALLRHVEGQTLNVERLLRPELALGAADELVQRVLGDG